VSDNVEKRFKTGDDNDDDDDCDMGLSSCGSVQEHLTAVVNKVMKDCVSKIAGNFLVS
jgi:hypothetical protein